MIFDIGGTLVDSYTGESFCAVMGRVAGELGVDTDKLISWWVWNKDRGYRRAAGLASTREELADAVVELGGTPDANRVEAAVRQYRESTAEWLVPRPDAVGTLERLKKAGYKIGVLSNCSSELPEAWSTSPLARLVDAAVFSCEVGICKPEPEIYVLASERLGVIPQECMYVGDGCDMELSGAAHVGMHPVLIRVPYEKDIVMAHSDPQNWQGPVIESLSELCDMLEC